MVSKWFSYYWNFKLQILVFESFRKSVFSHKLSNLKDPVGLLLEKEFLEPLINVEQYGNQ